MFPAVLNSPILLHAGTTLPGVTFGSSSLQAVKNHQLQHLPHTSVIDCDSAGGVAISAFSVKTANASDGVSLRPGSQENEISDIGKVLKLTARPYGGRDSARQYLSVHNRKRLYACIACDQEFKSRLNRNQHIEIMHPGEKLFVCAVCDKKFKLEGSLQRHCKGHDGRNKIGVDAKCPECKKEFASVSSMTRHMKIHNKDQQSKHTCDMCNKVFYRKDVRDQHRLRHDDARPHVCNVCQKGFKTNCGLTHHMNNSHKVNFLSCPVCGLLKPKKDLDAHMQQIHNIKEGATGITKIDESAGKQGTDGAIASQAGTFLEKASTHDDTCATRSETVQAWNEPFDELRDIAFNLPFEELDDIGPVP